jgi:hypothetical protein
MDYKVNDYPDLIKVDKSYVVNTNEEKYQEALKRRNMVKKNNDIEKRLDNLESSINTILSILTKGK